MKRTKIGLMVALVAIIGLTLVLKKPNVETKIEYGDISITLNEQFDIEQYEGEYYIMIPINTDLSSVRILVQDSGETVNALEIHDFLISIDTFIPTEHTKEFEINDKTIKIHVIVQ